MIAHTDRVSAAEEDQLPTIVKVAIPAVKARLHPGPTLPVGPVIEVQLRGLSVNRSIRTRDGNANVDAAVTLDHLKVYLCSKSPETQLQAPAHDLSPAPIVAQLLSDHLSVAIDTRARRQCLIVRCAQLSCSMVTPAIAQIQPLKQLWQTASRRLPETARSSHAASVLLYNVVRTAVEREQTFKQPSFAHESSYGLHHEDQRNIRRDLGWSILTRVRHWMRTAGTGISIAHDNIADYTVQALLTVDEFATGTDMFIRQQPCIQIAFGEGVKPTDSNAQFAGSDWQIFVKVDILRLLHNGKLNEKSAVERSTVSLFSISLGTRWRTSLKDGQRTHVVRSVNTIKDIQVELRDSVMSVILAILDLLLNAPSQETVTKCSSSNPDTVRQHWSVTADNHVAESNVHFICRGLRLSVSLGNTYANVANKTGLADSDLETARYEYCTTLVGLAGISVTLVAETELPHSLALPTDHIIAYIAATDLQVVLGHQRSPKNVSEVRQQIGVSLGHFAFHVRSPIDALGAFLVDWKRNHYP